MHKIPWVGAILGVLLLLVLLFSGQLSTNRTFTWQQPHTPIQTDSEASAYLVARNYKQLVDRAHSLLMAGETEGRIRYYDSDEEIDADLSRACAELMNTPIGAFAVETVKMTPTPLLSYYNIQISVTYRRTADEFAALQSLDSSSDLQGILLSALNTHAPSVLLMMDYYSPDLLAFDKNLTSACAENPDCCYGLSGYRLSTYPEEGLSRIVEIELLYDTTKEEGLRRRTAAEEQIKAILAQTDLQNLETVLRTFYDRITTSTEWVSRTSSADDTPYGVLMHHKGSSFGISSTFYQLCREAGIPCYLTVGTYQGTPHTWNMVYLNNAWHHIDAARGCLSPENNVTFMIPSENMDAYSWSNPNFTH